MANYIVTGWGSGGGGTAGPTGPTGPAGPAGTNGSTVLSGSGVPSSGTGSNGDFYINVSATTIYGPKAAGVWGSATSLVGAAGAAGVNGNAVLNGSGAPSAGTGSNGDFYINTANNFIYGPKASGAWPGGVSLVGPAGATGPAGPTGATGATGAAGSGGGFTGTKTLANSLFFWCPFAGSFAGISIRVYGQNLSSGTVTAYLGAGGTVTQAVQAGPSTATLVTASGTTPTGSGTLLGGGGGTNSGCGATWAAGNVAFTSMNNVYAFVYSTSYTQSTSGGAGISIGMWTYLGGATTPSLNSQYIIPAETLNGSNSGIFAGISGSMTFP